MGKPMCTNRLFPRPRSYSSPLHEQHPSSGALGTRCLTHKPPILNSVPPTENWDLHQGQLKTTGVSPMTQWPSWHLPGPLLHEHLLDQPKDGLTRFGSWVSVDGVAQDPHCWFPDSTTTVGTREPLQGVHCALPLD